MRTENRRMAAEAYARHFSPDRSVHERTMYLLGRLARADNRRAVALVLFLTW